MAGNDCNKGSAIANIGKECQETLQMIAINYIEMPEDCKKWHQNVQKSSIRRKYGNATTMLQIINTRCEQGNFKDT